MYESRLIVVSSFLEQRLLITKNLIFAFYQEILYTYNILYLNIFKPSISKRGIINFSLVVDIPYLLDPGIDIFNLRFLFILLCLFLSRYVTLLSV